MWKDILVFADGSDVGLARAKLALQLAQRFTAHLEAHAVGTVQPPPLVPMTTLMAHAYQGLLDDVRVKNANAVAALEALAPLGPSYSVYGDAELVGEVDEVATAAARAQDLVVLG